MLELEEERDSPTRIKVIGVGGGGMNAVSRMIHARLKGVEFIVMNTDEQVLQKSAAEERVQIGQRTTRGMGAGGDPDIGYKAAQEDRDRIEQAVKGADMVFVTAGMGGGTGTGAAPVVAGIAREQGALTVGVVTLPFHYEGNRRMDLARRGLAQLRDKVDTLITIKNDSIFKIVDRNTSVDVAFRMVDEILLNAVKGISDLINTAGLVNVDFADVRSIMGQTGDAIMGAGEGSGENRVQDAVNQAISNVLLEDTSIAGARAILINVTGGEDMSISEWKEVAELITAQVDSDANIIIGLAKDPSITDSIRVTVIATGFDRKKEHHPVEEQKIWKSYELPEQQAVSLRAPHHPPIHHQAREGAQERRTPVLPSADIPSAVAEYDEVEPEVDRIVRVPRPAPPERTPAPRRTAYDPDDYDTPAFLRRKK
ncbi:MAG: cell division protein FtsZ [Spirochaetales bacterium]|nr:cell division protein FtsZ [Spirochaetales bacterium]